MSTQDRANIEWLKLNKQALEKFGVAFLDNGVYKALYILGYISGHKDAISKS